jgi:hypothetical protein
MSDPEAGPTGSHTDPPQFPIDDEPSHVPNLTLIYGLIAFAIVAAIGFALLIVFPFYHRH